MIKYLKVPGKRMHSFSSIFNLKANRSGEIFHLSSGQFVLRTTHKPRINYLCNFSVIFEGISHSQRVFSMGFHTQGECEQSTNDRLNVSSIYGKL